jgi:hypothetical protein
MKEVLGFYLFFYSWLGISQSSLVIGYFHTILKSAFPQLVYMVLAITRKYLKMGKNAFTFLRLTISGLSSLVDILRRLNMFSTCQ